jgi:hypothetical protein
VRGPGLLTASALIFLALELAPIGEYNTINGRYEGDAIVGRVTSRRIALPYRCDLLSYLVCVIRSIYVTEVAKAANGMISTVAIELPSH